MRAMAGTAVAAGVAILLLVIAATMLSVTFATRGAMATNKPVIEVLHFVGAKNGFIAGRFQRHFLLLGLQGGAIGGGVAVVLFALAALVSRWFAATPGAEQTSALFGSFSIGIAGYAAVLGAGGADRTGDGGDLPAYREPDPWHDRLDMLASFARIIGFLTMAAGAAGAVLLGAGFCWFALEDPAEEVTLDRNADGIVVLTGGRRAHSGCDRAAWRPIMASGS